MSKTKKSQEQKRDQHIKEMKELLREDFGQSEPTPPTLYAPRTDTC